MEYTITLSKKHLTLIAKAVEDWSRFLSGQCEMWNATSMLTNGKEIQDRLDELKDLVTPDLPHLASYGWNGSTCPNDEQRRAIAMSYGIYRQILHFLTVEEGHHNVYSSPTLTCEEQGGLIKVTKNNNKTS